VTSDVRSAYLRLSETQRALVLWDQRIVPELEIERNQAETAYTAGEASLLSVLDVGRRLVDARVRRLEASIAFQQAAVGLDYSVGRSCAVR
jgi:outer membrane protein TolC